MKARLVGQGRSGGTRIYELPLGEAVLGTERGVEIQVIGSGVSRRHARILWDGRHHYIEDLKGTNGTLLNGQAVYRDRLQHLDVISLGRQCSLVYLVPQAASPQAGASPAPKSGGAKPVPGSPEPIGRGGGAPRQEQDDPEAKTIVSGPSLAPAKAVAKPQAPAPSSVSETRSVPPVAAKSPEPSARLPLGVGPQRPIQEESSDTEVDRDFLLRRPYKRPAVKGSTSKAGINRPPELEALVSPKPSPPPPPPAPPGAKMPAPAQPAVVERKNGKARADEAVPRPGPLRYAALVPEGKEAVPHVLAVGSITLGRSVSCDIVPDSEAISRFHARIEHSGNQLVLHDGGSLNGTFVNGKRVKTAILKDGDTISLSGVYSYKVVLRSTEPVARVPAVPSAPDPLRPALATPIPKASSRRPRAKVDPQPKPATAKAASPQKPPLPSPPAGKRGSEPASQWESNAPLADGDPSPSKWRTRLTGKWKTILEGKWLSKRDVHEANWLRAPEKPAVKPAEKKDKKAPPAKRPPATRIAEIVLSGIDVEGRFSKAGSYLIGRTRTADLRIESPSVSRRHALIVVSEDRTSAVVEDLESANGTSVNGQRVGRHRLADGDVVTLGGFPITVYIKKD